MDSSDRHPLGRPVCRATITPDKVTLNAWSPGLLYAGPAAMCLKSLPPDVVLADLFVIGPDGDELIVQTLPGLDLPDRAAQVVTDWATRAGYRRLWLSDRVYDLPGAVATGRAYVECPTCRLRWEDSSPAFWTTISESRLFPGFCPACNGSLPEWDVATEDSVPEKRHLREVA